MEGEYKKIILLKGLEPINDYQFSIVKSVLARDLGLTANMQKEYNKVKIADLMEKKFPGVACVNKLIDLFKEMQDCEDIVINLRNGKRKVMRQSRGKETIPMKKIKPGASSTEESTSTADGASGSVHDTPESKKQKSKTTPKGGKKKVQPTQQQSQLPEPSATSTQSSGSSLQGPQQPPATPCSSGSTKKNPAGALKPPWSTTTPGRLICSLSHSLLLWGPSTCMGSLQKNGRGADELKDTFKRMSISLEPTQPPRPPRSSGLAAQPCVPSSHLPAAAPASLASVKKPRLKAIPREAAREEGVQKGPKKVMVLKATEPFVYDTMEPGKKMFHATVATESQFFQVKVFQVNLKEKFVSKNIITISDYVGRNGFLEVYDASSVSEVSADQKMEVSSGLIQKANATPKIRDLYLQKPGTFVNGIYEVHKKNVLNEQIISYEIQDNTGKMEVWVYGRLTEVDCEEGDKLRLTCFELSDNVKKLRSVIHSFMKVIKSRKNKKQPLDPDSHMETSP
ncbi:myeloid cell nuclear differentiation antigen isoform X1 [Canis lupus familiaris]|uniref:Interferon gamma inducible protein 16 n=1 Tax=Canis lupus familiaris TaxID=9615 RepID=A0A8C0T5G9_CANLF|nr:myeloid cell nuclear differentiation antigen isoform X1 [Canis lupus familiaris]XP_038304657.1 myeloid cell nuclear differentiation antigen isoform X1 [Canis lupus familiaris]XP_038304658.1 myeloid cell nuclear differentiation antigen isoform X1 [Canis lupus familiaris]XP_038304659.1 myeloid cell nuclear differentiation antigen isoform X1 [Canis lupus familiaris]XP_038442321.1 myeloid cell nuclear differentiation antigen isoform X1 [Canis lupus familiaris]XP_038442322.1 myeloid cell nuclear